MTFFFNSPKNSRIEKDLCKLSSLIQTINTNKKIRKNDKSNMFNFLTSKFLDKLSSKDNLESKKAIRKKPIKRISKSQRNLPIYQEEKEDDIEAIVEDEEEENSNLIQSQKEIKDILINASKGKKIYPNLLFLFLII